MQALIINDINTGACFEINPKQWQQNIKQQNILLRYLAIPIVEDEHTLWLAIDSLHNVSAIEMFSFLTGKVIQPIIINNLTLKKLLKDLKNDYSKDDKKNFLLQDIDEIQDYTEKSSKKLQDTNDDSTILQLLNSIFEQSIDLKASDIHLEPMQEAMQVRMRIDGLLQYIMDLNQEMFARLIVKIKILSRLDISETRIPQDGSFKTTTCFLDNLECRVSIIPSVYGEKIVLRLQENSANKLDFSLLGMQKSQQNALKQILESPQGLILITGPTGSGKSISLYSAISWLNNGHKNIITVEDPIEMYVKGITQCQINPFINVGFAELLRAFLRQDPDVIMLGEIRDEESAKIALRAAQTGHLVLASLHTNDAQSAINRLLQLGIKQYEINSSLLLVVAQRLIRLLCEFCKTITQDCDKCFQGYLKRIGIFQFLTITKNSTLTNNDINYELDFKSLHESAQYLLDENLTDQKEIVRVLGNIGPINERV